MLNDKYGENVIYEDKEEKYMYQFEKMILDM